MKQISDVKITFGSFSADDFADDWIVTDAHIAELYNIRDNNVYLLPRGEQAKDINVVTGLCRWLLSRDVTPLNRVVAVGGGSVGDTVGFACSIFKRGTNLLHVPTTLVAMLDSSVGGKTGVDFDGVKNLLGTYFFADTFVDTTFLKTLDNVQMQSGMGELLKYRMLFSAVDELYSSGASLDKVIAACIEAKQCVCLRDPFCCGERNKLNFGHTVGHAMELLLDIPHGVAVANGIYYETLLARELGLCSAQYAERWTDEAKKQFDIYPLDGKILARTAFDKKNISQKVAFCLPCDFNRVEVDSQMLQKVLLGLCNRMARQADK